MVATDHQDPDARLPQLLELTHEEKAGVVVLPIAIEEIAGHQKQVHPFFDGKLHQIGESVTGGRAHGVHGGALVPLQPPQRTVQMDVGRVDELQGSPFSACFALAQQ